MERCCNCFKMIEYSGRCPECGWVKGSPAKELWQLYPGTELDGRYIIGETVGFGGFGITYKAWDKKLELTVAVKEYYPSGIASRTPGTSEVIIYAKKRTREFNYGKERFLDEARNMAKFSSEPNIINVFEYFEANGTAYIVMEYLNGTTLSWFMQLNGKKTDIGSALEIIECMGGALSTIHGKGIIHRDVSPDNIFLCLDGKIKLIDFGAARFSQDESRKMTIILKPGFAPPEQYEKINEQGPWTDVYALGATFYYMLTGLKPEESTNRRIKDNVAYPRSLDPAIPENISNAVMKALAVDIPFRYKSADEFLAAIHSEKKVRSLEDEKKQKSIRRGAGIGIAAAVFAAGVTASAFSWFREKGEETLLPCKIEMVWCRSGDREADNAREKALQELTADFRVSFPEVEIELTGCSETELAERVRTGINGIYEYCGTSAAANIDLRVIYDSEQFAACSALTYAEGYFGGCDKLPLGYDTALVFEKAESEDDKAPSADDIAVSEPSIAKILGNAPDPNAYEEFVSGNVRFYAAYSDSFSEISSEVPVKVYPLPDGTKVCRYTDIWAAANVGKRENKAESKLLAFMLTNNAQDTLHLRGASGHLPVNDIELNEYTAVYSDLDGLTDTDGGF